MEMDRDLLLPPIIRANNGLFSIFSSLIGNNLTENNNQGVSEEFKNNLRENIADEEFISKEKQCSICLEDFKLGDKYIILPCSENNDSENNDSEDNHIFHSGDEICSGIKPWLERKNTCPMCRKEFPKRNNLNTPLFETITIHTSPIIPIYNNNINPNDLDNRISTIIDNYINEIEETNEQRDIQLAIEASLNDR